MQNTGKYSSNVMLKIVLMVYKTKIPEFVHKCPFKPFEFVRENLILDNKVVAMLPTGVYRMNMIWKYKEEEFLFQIDFTVEIF